MACEGRRQSADEPTPLRRRGRPRSDVAERAILRAGARLLEERGVQRMSMQAVAADARVSKATIYRRWPSKDALVLDLVSSAMADSTGDHGTAVDGATDARGELLAWVRAGLESERTPLGVALQHLVRRAAEDQVLAARLRGSVLEQHRRRFAAIVERGIHLGQIRPDLDIARLLDLVSGPLIFRKLIAGSEAPVGDPTEHARVIVDMLWPGIRAAPAGGLE